MPRCLYLTNNSREKERKMKYNKGQTVRIQTVDVKSNAIFTTEPEAPGYTLPVQKKKVIH